jgi:Leucine-rich repeat (LRR) protein
MTTAIERYLNSLSDDISILDISSKNIKYLPDLTKFKNLEELYCNNNQLTTLPTLPPNLKKVFCSNNQLTTLPTLPPNLKKVFCSNNKLTLLPTLPLNLKVLYCSNNQLALLPTLPQNLEELYCSNNQLTSLPTLPQNLAELYCSNNQLTLLPTLPPNLAELYCYNNPIYEIVKGGSLIKIKKNIQLLNSFRHLYYCLQFKKQLRKWLWEKVREKHIMDKYYPKYLIENLGEDDDLDTFLDYWK